MTAADARKLKVGARVKWDDGTLATYLYVATGHGLLHVQKAAA